MSRTVLFVLALAAVLVSPTANATPTTGRCPALFGSARSRAANKLRRREQLYWIMQDQLGVVIAHGSDRWREPDRVDLLGLEVSVKDGKAAVEVDAELARRAGCAAGTYAVGVDDAIGKAAILAVLEQGLLLELDGELQYWGHGRCCQWMMAWGSRYRMVMRVRKNTGSVSRRPAPRNKPKRKPKRKRR